MQWLLANLPAVLSVLAAVLSVVVMVMHLAHKDSVANQVQALEDLVNKLAGKQG